VRLQGFPEAVEFGPTGRIGVREIRVNERVFVGGPGRDILAPSGWIGGVVLLHDERVIWEDCRS